MPNVMIGRQLPFIKAGDLETDLAFRERFMRYQLVGEVMAHQG